MHNILLSSVGRRVELVRAFRSAYQRLGIEGNIVGTDCDWLAPALQEVDQPCLVPRFDNDAYIPSFLEICERESISIIFPLNDGELIHLANHAEQVEALGSQVAVLSPEPIKVCGDKWLTHQFFTELGLPVARSWLPDAGLPEGVKYPLFIKPRDGSAGESTFRINSSSELDFFATYVRNPIVQEFLTGPEITSDVVCGMDGQVLSIVSRQRIAVRGGEAIKSVTIHDHRIEQACHEIAARLPAKGPITVQCMLQDGIPHFIEINARLGGGIPLAMAADVDVPALLLSDIAQLNHSELNRQPKLDVYMTRCDESFFLCEATREQPTGSRLRPR